MRPSQHLRDLRHAQPGIREHCFAPSLVDAMVQALIAFRGDKRNERQQQSLLPARRLLIASGSHQREKPSAGGVEPEYTTGHTRDIATASKSSIALNRLGPDERAAVDRLLREFSLRGWRDVDGAASAVVQALIARNGLASRAVVLRAVPGDFFVRNRITRAQVGRLLDGIAGL